MFGPFVLRQTNAPDEDFAEGMQFYEAARFAEAAEAFKRSIKRDQSNAEAQYYLANSYFRMSRDQDAVKAYKQAIKLNPKHVLAFNNLGTAYHRLGDFKQAREAYTQVYGVDVSYREVADKLSQLKGK